MSAARSSSRAPGAAEAPAPTTRAKVKCVVWDLDETVWDGTLVEDDDVRVREDVVAIIEELDRRGVLHSIASKNDAEQALEKLESFGLRDYFLYPQISWGPKSRAIENIAQLINIGLDTIAFVDNDPFEREEVLHCLPQVLCLDPEERSGLLQSAELMPRFVTPDSNRRRLMYMSDMKRNQAEDTFEGTKEDFLATLGMVFTISDAGEDDLKRAEELTVRTHQLNTTGYTYSYEELDELRRSDSYRLLVADLVDKYGAYGKIGLSLLELGPDVWMIKLLLMSCRVMARGVGSVLINHIRRQARDSRVALRAEFRHTGVNRMMYMAYKFAGFREIEQRDDLVLLENDLSHVHAFPSYLKLEIY